MFDRVGIIGVGFVGNAIRQYFNSRPNIQTFTYDVNSDLSTCHSIADLMGSVNLVFVSVPTPMNVHGDCNTSIVEGVLAEIDAAATPDTIVIIKSTIPPRTTDVLQTRFENLTIIFSPEFLTEANAVEDFALQDRILLGTKFFRQDIYNFFAHHFPNAQIKFCTSRQAELVKYVTNTFLALKVIFANEIYDLADALSIDYPQFIELLKLDTRIGSTHWQVPGPDGKRGYGGTCFPKDTSALLNVAYDNNIDLSLIAAAWNKNIQLRPDRDWEKLYGRAVL